MDWWGWPNANICMLTRWGDQMLLWPKNKEKYPRKKLFIACAEKKWTFSWIFVSDIFYSVPFVEHFFPNLWTKVSMYFFSIKAYQVLRSGNFWWILRAEFIKFFVHILGNTTTYYFYSWPSILAFIYQREKIFILVDGYHGYE